MKDLTANNQGELLELLMKIDIRVPPRNEGRTTEHCETWSICRLLATLAKRDKIGYPIRMIKRERPDFLLTAGERYIGIEVTEAIHQEYAKATALPEADVDGSVIDASLFKWGASPRKLHDLRSIASQKKLTGPGWEGTSVESEYADAIFDVVALKTRKLQNQSFAKFVENWLAIYCNLALPTLDLGVANQFFTEKAITYRWEDGFSGVFVEAGAKIISYSHGGAEVMELVDLWRTQ